MEEQSVPSGGRYNFTVVDVDDLWENLRREVEMVEDLFESPYGNRKFTILDLDGNELGFLKG